MEFVGKDCNGFPIPWKGYISAGALQYHNKNREKDLKISQKKKNN